MFTPLAKLAIGLSATMATGFYYIAAAPPASAQYVCGPGNFSSACGGGAPSPPTPSPTPITDPVEEVPVIESPAPITDLVEEVPVIESPAPIITDPTQTLDDGETSGPTRPYPWIYNPPTTVKPPTAIPEPGTVVALLVTGAGIICCGRKRNKQVRQQR